MARSVHVRHWPSSGELDDLFVKHYAGLVAGAQQLVGRDRQAAEDLVHDAYVRLALRQFDASSVHNVEGYLFITLRNVHLSQVRRRQSKMSATVSIVDYESAVAGLCSMAHEEERRDAHDALRQVVRYACHRKSTSKVASVLVLRFFHGYYPGEIARVVQATETTVAQRLRMARAEARAFLADPGRVRDFYRGPVPVEPAGHALGDAVSIAALQQTIFDARTGACLTSRALDRFYSDETCDPLDVETLAHLVCCPTCLDIVNRRLGLPLLSERDPSDRLGRGDSSSGHGGGGGGADLARTLRTRLQNTREEHPQVLQIAVNGLFVSSQAVNGRVIEQSQRIMVAEQIGFVEILDEHDTCLLYLDVEPPPAGGVERSALVPLSGGRHLTATLSFAEATPTLHVVYEDPSPTIEPTPISEQARHVDVAASRRPSLWPMTLRFVIAGIVLSLLLANPRQTLAAMDNVRRAIVEALAQLIETVRPRAALPSNPVSRLADAVPLASPASVVPVLPTPPARGRGALSDVELTETMVDALRLLDEAGALTTEQIAVRPGADRRLHIAGVVGTEARRQALTSALGTLPARYVRVGLVTAEEASRRSHGTPANNLLRSEEVTRDREPAAFEHLRRYLSARPDASLVQRTETSAAADPGEAIRQLSKAFLARSLQARMHARTVQDLVASVPPAHAGSLSPAGHTTWRGLVRRHAERLRSETASLRRELEQVFAPTGAEDEPALLNEPSNNTLWDMAGRLHTLASVHDVAVRRAFTVATDRSESLDVSTPAFRRSLLDAERLVEALLTALAGATNR